MVEKNKAKGKEPEKEEEESEAAETPVQAPAGGKWKKAIVIALIIAGLSLLAGVPAYFLLHSGGHAAPNAEMFSGEEDFQKLVPEGYQEEDELDEDEEPLGALFPLDTFIVNLAGGKSYLRCQMQVEFKERDVPNRFYVRLVPIRDAAIKILSAYTPGELMGSDGKEALKEALKEMINATLKKEEVANIYFTQFVVQ